eukprot:Nitzschia sp. Nitz4//scaffold75_size92586//40366//43833//NITZ4_004853-RA/size92586-processed-gene-0.43-mRNA-1//-1//CDS//3329557699//7776//frame0
MFGGLDLKGDDENQGSGAATPSAFGFLNATTPAPADPPAEVTSGFSFLNAAAAPAESSPVEPPTSGFSFLQPAAGAGASASASTGTASEPAAPPAEASAPVAESGFDFLIPSPDKAPGIPQSQPSASGDSEDVPAVAAPAPPTAPTSSAFDFLSATPSQDQADAPPAETPAPVPDLPLSGFAPAAVSSSSLPAGAGITFGTTAAKPVVRKKKTRAQKIGQGGPPVPTPAPAPAPVAPPPPKAADPAPPAPEPASDPPESMRDAAVEAQRRAEQFMNQKVREQASMATATTEAPTPALGPSASSDEEVARAQLAAQEAQKMASAQGKQKGFMGTFFKGFGSGGSSSNLSSTATGVGVDRTLKRDSQSQSSFSSDVPKSRATPVQDDDDMVQVTTSAPSYSVDSTDKDSTATENASTFAPVVVPTYNPAPVTQTPPSVATSVLPKPVAIEPTPIVVKELQPAPKKKKTATQMFEEYQALFAQSVHRTMQQVETVRSQQRMLQEERFVALAKERLSTQQIRQTEAQLQAAVEEEDYELADQLGQVVDAHKREKSEVASVLQSIAKGLEQLESQKTLVVQGVATCFDNLALHIKELREQELTKDKESDPETLKQFATISKQLSAEQERLQHDCTLIERDEQLVAEERKEVESAISEQSGEYEQQRDSVKANLEGIEQEIAELRKQLEIKTKVAAGLRTEMHGLEDSISKVRVKFARQLARVEKKELSVKENRMELDTEQAAFKRQKEAHELQVQSHSEALLAHDELMNNLDTELAMCKDFASVVPTKLGFMDDKLVADPEDPAAESELAQLQADVVKCEAAVSEAKALVKATGVSISNLEAEHEMLVVKIPQLEAEKKMAAAKRDFKAASKASKEIKDASARLKECEAELVGDILEKKKSAESELEKLTVELDEARRIAQEHEKISAVAKMQGLAKQINHLLAVKTELCGDASPAENTVKGVGAFVLDGQIKALRNEGQSLGSKYGCWEEIESGGEIPADVQTEEKDPSSPPEETKDDGLTSEERIVKVRELVKKIQEAEVELEAAVEKEDYDEAAKLQDVFEALQKELDSINLTDEESAVAFSEEEPVAKEEVVEESGGEEDGEESAPVQEEEATTPKPEDDSTPVEDKLETNGEETETGGEEESAPVASADDEPSDD